MRRVEPSSCISTYTTNTDRRCTSVLALQHYCGHCSTEDKFCIAALQSAFISGDAVLELSWCSVQRPLLPRYGGSVVGENVPVYDPPRKPVSTGSKRSYQDMDKVSNCILCWLTASINLALHASMIIQYADLLPGIELHTCQNELKAPVIVCHRVCVRIQPRAFAAFKMQLVTNMRSVATWGAFIDHQAAQQ